MSELAAALRAPALLGALLASGWAVARLTGRRPDVFAATWWGLAVASIAGLLLARAGSFSLATLAGSALATAVVALVAGGRSVPGLGVRSPDPAPARGVRAWACLAGLLAVLAAWPPFETFLGAADSTMYVNAGVHLARTGTYDVAETTGAILTPDLVKFLYPSIGVRERGPFIRLAGGLLMPEIGADHATPAFFALLPVWTGVLAALGGPALAPAAAPLGLGLAVWAVTLFAGETFGLAAAMTTTVVFLGNFAVWWFGRFTMSEPLTIAFVWAGLVMLARGAPFAAGAMLGLAGLARTETLVFIGIALAASAVWNAIRPREVLRLAAGFALPTLVAMLLVLGSPNHHLTYLQNHLSYVWMVQLFRVLPAVWDGRLIATAALLSALPIVAGAVAAWRGVWIVRSTLRTVVTLGIVAGLVGYLGFGGAAEPVRHLGWLASSMSPLGLALGAAGIAVMWRRGGWEMRFAVMLVALACVVFVPKPQISAYQPWAMRRYLPLVLPGLAVGVGVVVAALLRSPRVVLRAGAVAAVAAIVILQARPILAVRERPYFAGSLAAVDAIARSLPSNALVVLDAEFADLQLQVPLWLTFGRETLTVAGRRPGWRAVLARLVTSERPIYWIQNRLSEKPDAPGLVFTPMASEGKDFTVVAPDSPRDLPPTAMVGKRVLLEIYGVAAGEGGG